MSLTAYLSFMTACLIIELTPGPNMAYLAVLSASNGRRAGFAATLGIALGLLVVGISAALGISALISNSPLAYQLLRWGGVGYLLFLAWDGWREEPETSPGKTDGPAQNAKFFKRGLIVNLLNPKAAVFYIAILPGFITAPSAALSPAVALTLTYVIIATAIHSLVVILAATAQQFLKNRKRRLMARRAFSLALAGIALWFALSTGRGGL